MIPLLTLLLLLPLQESRVADDLAADLASALSATPDTRSENSDAAPLFLSHFDKKMPGYDTLEANVWGLTNASRLASSIDVVKDEGDQKQRSVDLDWELVVTVKGPGGPTEVRHETVKLRIERRGRQWKIVTLEPVAFFAPPKTR